MMSAAKPAVPATISVAWPFASAASGATAIPSPTSCGTARSATPASESPANAPSPGHESTAKKPMAFVLGPADSFDETKWRAVSGGQQRLADAQLAVYPSIDRAAHALARYLAARRGD